MSSGRGICSMLDVIAHGSVVLWTKDERKSSSSGFSNLGPGKQRWGAHCPNEKFRAVK